MAIAAFDKIASLQYYITITIIFLLRCCFCHYCLIIWFVLRLSSRRIQMYNTSYNIKNNNNNDNNDINGIIIICRPINQ